MQATCLSCTQHNQVVSRCAPRQACQIAVATVRGVTSPQPKGYDSLDAALEEVGWTSSTGSSASPYVFAIVNDLKTKARARGEDIIDLGMGNPDMATPKHIVDKLVEAAKNPKNHRYSASRGITRLRVAMAKWYRDRYAVRARPRTRKSSPPSAPRKAWRTWRWRCCSRATARWCRTRPIRSTPTRW